jgi:hypothetical protein
VTSLSFVGSELHIDGEPLKPPSDHPPFLPSWSALSLLSALAVSPDLSKTRRVFDHLCAAGDDDAAGTGSVVPLGAAPPAAPEGFEVGGCDALADVDSGELVAIEAIERVSRAGGGFVEFAVALARALAVGGGEKKKEEAARSQFHVASLDGARKVDKDEGVAMRINEQTVCSAAACLGFLDADQGELLARLRPKATDVRPNTQFNYAEVKRTLLPFSIKGIGLLKTVAEEVAANS